MLVIDDEPDMCRAIALVLKKGGFDVETSADGEEGLALLRGTQFDAVLLDILMPGMDGIEVLKTIRAQDPLLAILMLSAVDAMGMKAEAFEADADDYVTKPFGVMELPARIRAILRRGRPLYDLSIDIDRHRFRFGERSVNISPLQLMIMQYLLAHAGSVVTHEELLRHVWAQRESVGPTSRPENRVLAVISALRRKIGGRSQRLIQTVPGGYRLNPDAVAFLRTDDSSAQPLGVTSPE